MNDWTTYKRCFVMNDGRVIDPYQNNCSHTESQGLGLLFAEAHDDQATFDLVSGFLKSQMRRPSDWLYGWRFDPSDTVQHVRDWNNATDGDLLIAAAHLRAAQRWGRPELAASGRATAKDVLNLLVQDIGSRTVLLPGMTGFATDDGVIVNPSYYAFPLIAELAAAVPSRRWDKLASDGLSLIEEGRFGRWRLPPDWLMIDRRDGSLHPHPHPHPSDLPTFGYNAIRVPLYLTWGQISRQEACTAFCAWAAASPVQPAWVDLTTDKLAGVAASPGMMAIAQLTSAVNRGALKAEDAEVFAPLRASPDYYSASLLLLARLAWQETRAT